MLSVFAKSSLTVAAASRSMAVAANSAFPEIRNEIKELLDISEEEQKTNPENAYKKLEEAISFLKGVTAADGSKRSSEENTVIKVQLADLEMQSPTAGPTAAVETLKSAAADAASDSKLPAELAASTYLRLGEVHRILGQMDECLDVYKKYTKVLPEDKKAYGHFQVGHSHLGAAQLAAMKNNDQETANKHATAAVESLTKTLDIGGLDQQSSHNAKFALGDGLGMLGKLDEAFETYDNLCKETPDFPHAFRARGRINHSKSRLDEAVKDYSSALDIMAMSGGAMAPPIHCELLDLRGRAKLDLSDAPGAEKDFTAALAVMGAEGTEKVADPSLPEVPGPMKGLAFLNRAFSRLQQCHSKVSDDPEVKTLAFGARSDLDEAVKAHPDLKAVVLQNRAMASALMGDTEAAKKDAQEAAIMGSMSANMAAEPEGVVAEKK